MRAWRICKEKWARAAFSGTGGADYPGRWNLLGVKAVYCADSRALGSLEVLAHVARKKTLSRARFVAIPIEIPEEYIFTSSRLPKGWDAKPHTSISQHYGNRILHKHVVLRVPSVVVKGEYCFVLNPEHPEFSRLLIGKTEPLTFDDRVIT